MVPDDDQAIVLPCASVMVIIVLLNDAFTCATPDAMFLRSRRRTRAVWLPCPCSTLLRLAPETPVSLTVPDAKTDYFFLPAMAFAGPLRVRALVCVR